MIRKYLACGKQLYFTAKKLDNSVFGSKDAPPLVIELLMPIKAFWDTEKLLQQLDYMLAAHEDPVAVSELQREILNRVVKYTVLEKERTILYERLRGPEQ